MRRLSNILNCLIYIILIIAIISIIPRTNSRYKVMPISLWYVYSQSMEPTLMTYDGFILISSKEYADNDVITFVPKHLNQPYVTHRIVGTSKDGKFITKGDNNPMSDQQGGEPLVAKEQILGKAVEFNNKVVNIAKLGLFSNRIKSITKGFNVFLLLSAAIIIILFEYVMEKLLKKKAILKKKRYRLIDIAPFFDYSFIILSILIIINALLIGVTIRGWGSDTVSFVVVSTEGLSSPMPGERFSRVIGIGNNTFVPFITIFEADNPNTGISPGHLQLKPYETTEYNVSILAPERLGYYTEQINKRTYPFILPNKLFEQLYWRHPYSALIITFIPGILLILICYAWWMKRWQSGRGIVMPWLIYLRNALRSL